jgi:hypothetical protein
VTTVFLNRIIDDGIKAAEADYTEAPHKRSGLRGLPR